MPSKLLVLFAAATLVLGFAVLVGSPAGVERAEAEGTAGYIAGPWRCKTFSGGDGIEQHAAAWLYRYASTGPSTVVSLPSASGGAYTNTTLCAWDPGFAAEQWIQLERDRRQHEAQVRARKQKLQKHKQKGGGELFPEEAPLDDDEERGGSR